MKKRSRQILGIVGIVFAVIGGAAWFFQLFIPAILLWAVAGIILIKLNKRKSINRDYGR